MQYPQNNKQLLLKKYFKQMIDNNVPIYEDILERILLTSEEVLEQITSTDWWNQINIGIRN